MKDVFRIYSQKSNRSIPQQVHEQPFFEELVCMLISLKARICTRKCNLGITYVLFGWNIIIAS